MTRSEGFKGYYLLWLRLDILMNKNDKYSFSKFMHCWLKTNPVGLQKVTMSIFANIKLPVLPAGLTGGAGGDVPHGLEQALDQVGWGGVWTLGETSLNTHHDRVSLPAVGKLK